MDKLQSLGADTICNIAAFVLGADIVALLTTSRCVLETVPTPPPQPGCFHNFKKLKIWTQPCFARVDARSH